MNVFYLHEDPVIAASYQCDKHIIKMITENHQMFSLCVKHIFCPASYNDYADYLTQKYTKRHLNHPCTIWMRQSQANWRWMFEFQNALLAEYDRRYGKKNKYVRARRFQTICLDFLTYMDRVEFDQPVQCMPDKYKQDDPVEAYRLFYLQDKAYFAKWKLGQPEWYANQEYRRTAA